MRLQERLDSRRAVCPHDLPDFVQPKSRRPKSDGDPGIVDTDGKASTRRRCRPWIDPVTPTNSDTELQGDAPGGQSTTAARALRLLRAYLCTPGSYPGRPSNRRIEKHTSGAVQPMKMIARCFRQPRSGLLRSMAQAPRASSGLLLRKKQAISPLSPIEASAVHHDFLYHGRTRFPSGLPSLTPSGLLRKGRLFSTAEKTKPPTPHRARRFLYFKI